MKKRKIILLTIAVAILCGAWYGYREYTRKVTDLSHVKAQARIGTEDLISSFEMNEKTANEMYLGKVIAVKGSIKSIEKDDKGYYSVILGDASSMSSVRCSMDMDHQAEITTLAAGTSITVKGACTGFTADELLGSDVILNRCVIEK
ncbi:MAG: hypothetical protein JNK14_12535 [Chitinophagaceae bacterium]|nr:hypothetical protein [Chitinophagaceae bacterium]